MKRRGGFSLIEVLIAMVLLSLLMAAVFSLLDTSTRTYEVQYRRTTIEGLARDHSDEVVRELREAGEGTLALNDPYPSSQTRYYRRITFQRNTGYQTDGIVYGTPISIYWQRDPDEGDNDTDDDGDGLIDEGSLVREENGEIQILLDDGVCEDGVLFSQPASGSIEFTLKLQKRNMDGTIVERDATTAVQLRNP